MKIYCQGVKLINSLSVYPARPDFLFFSDELLLFLSVMAAIRLHIGKTTVVFDDSRPLREKAGRFSRVYTGRTEWGDRKVLVKKLRHSKSLKESVPPFFPVLTTIRHPALQSVYGAVNHEGDIYVVSAFVEGTDLKQRLEKKGRFRDRSQVKRIVLDLLSGLDVLHTHRIIHADIKPANIIVREEKKGTLHAVLIDPGEAVHTSHLLPGKKPFALMYSPPEQVLGFTDLINASSDLYSLGVVIWEMLTGNRPFYASHPAGIINLQLNRPLKKLRTIPQNWFDVIARATAKSAFPKPPAYYSRREIRERLMTGQQQRYLSAEEMAEDIEIHI